MRVIQIPLGRHSIVFCAIRNSRVQAPRSSAKSEKQTSGLQEKPVALAAWKGDVGERRGDATACPPLGLSELPHSSAV